MFRSLEVRIGSACRSGSSSLCCTRAGLMNIASPLPRASRGLVRIRAARLPIFPRVPRGDGIDAATHNTAILIDTDKVFHGVERVTPKSFFPEIGKGATQPLRVVPVGRSLNPMVVRWRVTNGRICGTNFVESPLFCRRGRKQSGPIRRMI